MVRSQVVCRDLILHSDAAAKVGGSKTEEWQKVPIIIASGRCRGRACCKGGAWATVASPPSIFDASRRHSGRCLPHSDVLQLPIVVCMMRSTDFCSSLQ